MTLGGETLNFSYDASGAAMAVTYDGSTYYYASNLQGDIVAILDASGSTVVAYTYDAWGKLLTTTGSMASTLGAKNPLRYRGYVYDTETGLYYLQSRYYNPEMGRFVNADNYPSTGQGLTGNNMFAYCGNNPVCRQDVNGEAFETVFDIISLASSVADVVANPANPWAWAGLIGDVIDVAVPFVTGVGETTRAVGTSVRVITNVSNTVDTARTFRRTADKLDDIKDSVGTYVILYKNGDNYVGKGPFNRAIQSAKEHLRSNDSVSSIIWAPTSSNESAFIAEYLLQTVRGVGSQGKNTFNKIWSPGRLLY